MKRLQCFISLGMVTAVLLSFPGPPREAFAAEEIRSVPPKEQFRKALEVDPENPALRYHRGVALLHDDQPEKAVSELCRAYPFLFDSIEMNYSLGVGLTRTNDADSAMLYMEQAEALGALGQPQIYPLPSAYYNIGLVYLEAGQAQDALDVFGKVLELAPDRTDIYRLLGEIHSRESGNEKAIESFRTYLDHYPDDDEVREQLFAIFLDNALNALGEDRLDAARLGFEKALEISPASPLASYYLGSLAYRQGKWEETVRELAPNYADYSDDLRRAARPMLFKSSIALLRGGDPGQAREAAAALLRRHPENIRILYHAGNVHLALNEFLQARKHYEQLLKLEPTHRGAVLNLAIALNGAGEELTGKGKSSAREGDYFEARQRLAAVESVRRERASSLADEGRVFLGEGKLDEARQAFNSSLALQPDHSKALAGQRELESLVSSMFAEKVKWARRALNKGQLETAEGFYNSALELKADAAVQAEKEALIQSRCRRLEGLLAAAREAQDGGDCRRAKTLVRMALEMAPDNTEAGNLFSEVSTTAARAVRDLLLAAGAALDAGEPARSLSYYRKVLVLEPANRFALAAVESGRAAQSAEIDSLASRASEALAGGEIDRAKALIGRALEMDPYSASALSVSKRIAAAGEEVLRGGTARDRARRNIDKIRHMLERDSARQNG
ncbi:MAG: tetratricopeptide repeat protein [Desulfuromonadales bacterium]